MTRFSFRNADLAAKQLTRDEYRAIGFFAALSMLLVATITFFVSLSWEVTAVVSLLAIPGSLFGGALCIFFHRFPKPKVSKEALKQVSLRQVALNVVVGSLIYSMMCYAIPTPFPRLIVAIAILAIPAMARRVYDRHNGAS